jgi:bla regulator protein blaR1
MIAPFVRELEQVFGWLLSASWQASALALFVLVIQRVLSSRLNPRWRYALWLLVLLRLVLPVQPESALSLFQFAPPPPAQLVTTVTEPWQPLFTGKPYPSPSDPEPMMKPNYPFSYFTLLAFLWLGGAMILLILTWEANRRFARQVANSPEISDPDLLKLFAEARAELGVRRAIRLIENNQLQSPAIMGLFQPTLLLPADVRGKFDERELRFIFLHELAHLKRGDVMVQALIALLQILHWFNPALWFAFRRMRIDREPATDALVLSRTGEEEKERYGLMLIKLLEHFNQRHSLPTLVGILEDKDQFKRRFSLIARFTRGAYGWSVLGVLLIGILGIACLTKSKANENSALTADYLITNLERFADGVHSIDYSETRGDPKGSHSFEHWQEMGELQRIERFTPNLDTHGKPSGTFHVIISYDGDYGYMYSPDSDRLVRQKEPFLDLTEGYSSGLEGGPLMPFEFLDKKGVRSSSGRVTLQTLKSPDALAARATLEPDKNRSWEGHPCIAVKISGGNDRWDSQAPVDFVAYFAKDLDFYPVAYEVYKHGKLSRRYWVVKFASIPLVSGKVFRYPELAGGFCYDSDTLHSSSGGGYSFESMAPSDLKINTLSKADFTIQPPPGGYIEDRDDGDKLIKVPPAQAPPQAPAQSDPPTNTTDTKAANAQAPTAVQTTAATSKSAVGSASKPSVKFTITLVEIDEKTYEQNAQSMDEAVRTGNSHFFAYRKDGTRIFRTIDMFLLVGQSGWYSEGETQDYVSAVSNEMRDGKPFTTLQTKSVFTGFKGSFTWSKSGALFNSEWSVTEPLGPEKPGAPDNMPPSAAPTPSVIPQFHTITFTDKDWKWEPGKEHGFWVGETYGPVSRLPAGKAPVNELLKPSRFAVFITAQPSAEKADAVAAPQADATVSLPPAATANPAPKADAVPAAFPDGVKAAQVMVNDYPQPPGPAPSSPAGAATGNPDSGQILVEFKVVEIQDDVYLAHQAEIDAGVEKGGAEIFNLFNNLKGVSVLSAPSVTTKPGLKADTDVVREFPYPTSFDPAKVIQGVSVQGIGTNLTANVAPTPRDFVTADVGVKAEITPSLEQGKIILNGKFSVIDFEGFTKSNLAGVNMPSFETRETHFYEALDDNQLMGIWIPGAHFDEQMITDHDSLGKIISEKKEAVKKRLLIFLQARLVK